MEAWKSVAGWPYEVSESGKVRNVCTKRQLKSRVHVSGYEVVQLWKQMSYWTVGTHQLVAAAFISEKPGEYFEVAHRDGNRLNNHYLNLKWSTHKENMDDREAHGRTARSATNGKTKFSDELVARAKAEMLAGTPLPLVAQSTGIPVVTLNHYHNGRRRAYVKPAQLEGKL